MGTETGISWADSTWNPWMGCTPVASGCAHCYARREMTRYGRDFATVTRAKPATFHLPLKIPSNSLVFVCSWSDFFHEAADKWRHEAWDVIDQRRDLTFIIPTKRIQRAGQLLPWGLGTPWPHVWLLVSASTQAEVDVVVPQILRLPAAVRGVSLEPLLGEVDLYRGGWSYLEALRPPPGNHRGWRCGLDWVIVAGESGGPEGRALVRRAELDAEGQRFGWRPKDDRYQWVRSLRNQCQSAGVPFHFKGWGGPKPTSGGRLLDGREWLEFPEEAI